jgi:hypothetical protein
MIRKLVQIPIRLVAGDTHIVHTANGCGGMEGDCVCVGEETPRLWTQRRK